VSNSQKEDLKEWSEDRGENPQRGLAKLLGSNLKTERDTLAENLAAERAAPTAQDKAEIVDDLMDLLGCQWFEVYHQLALLAYKAKDKS